MTNTKNITYKNIGIYTYKLDDTDNYMIGETEVKSGKSLEESCKRRMKQYLNPKVGVVTKYSDLHCFLIPNRTKNHADTEFIKFILEHYPNARLVKQNDEWRKNKGGEIVTGVTREEIDEAMNAWSNNNLDIYRTENFPLRNYQQKIADKTVYYLKSHYRCLLNLSTRSGKSFLSLEIARLLGAENILVLTPYPSAIGSFRDITIRHMNFLGWSFYNKKDTKEDTLYQPNHNVVFLSWQIFDLAQKKAKLNNLFEQVKFDVIIVDETHNTSSSFRSGDILEIINPNKTIKEIHLSGTPYNDILGERFSKEETISFDFIDLLTLDKKTNCVGFPKLSIYNVCNMEFLNNILRTLDPNIFDRNEGISLDKVFATESRTRLFLTWVFTKVFNIDDELFLNETEEESRNFFNGKTNKHILLRVPNLDAANWTTIILRDLIKEAKGLFAKYKVCQVSGKTDSGNDIDTSAGDLERQVNEFQANNDYTITVTCNKLTTGVTLKKCDCVLQMRKTSSAETFVQVLFRPMTPNEGKTEAHLYNFDAESMLQVVRETIRVRRAVKPDQTDIKCMKELFNVVNIKKVWADNSLDFNLSTPEEYLGAIKKLPVNLDSAKLITNIPELTSDQINALINVTPAELKTQVNITDKVDGAVKQKTYKDSYKENINTLSKSSKNKEITPEVVKKLYALVEHLDWSILLNDIKDFDDLYNNIKVDIDTKGNVKLVRN